MIEPQQAPVQKDSSESDCDMDNPYTPPQENSIEESTNILYSSGQIAWATFLGAPIAGCILLALNYRQLGNATAANIALILGVFGSVLFNIIALLLPESFPNSILPAAYTFGMYYGAKSMQGEIFEARITNGGKKGSSWFATGVGIVGFVLMLLAMLTLVLLAPAEWFPEELK